MRYRLITTEAGNQIMVRDLPHASVTMTVDDDPIASDEELQIAPEDFAQVVEQAKTNSVDSATISENISNNPNMTQIDTLGLDN